MATNIPPHNLNELIDGINHMIKEASVIGGEVQDKVVEVVGLEHTLKVVDTEFSSNATAPRPHRPTSRGQIFPTGGIIYDRKEMIQLYATGKGRVVYQS